VKNETKITKPSSPDVPSPNSTLFFDLLLLVTCVSKKLLRQNKHPLCDVKFMGMKLKVDGKEIPMNDFVSRFIQGVVVGGVTSLKGIKENWEKIEIEVTK
jgi:hypothetical protein